MEAGVPDVRAAGASGPATHVRCTISELRRLGHVVRLVAQYAREIWQSDDLEHFRRVQVPGRDDGPMRAVERVTRRLQWTLGLPYFAYFDARRFAAACATALGPCDLLYERMAWMGLGGDLAARRLGIPHVLEVNGDHLAELTMLGEAPGRIQRRVSMRLMRGAAQRAAHAVATGEGWRAQHVLRWRVDPARVSVVDNGSELVDLLERDQLRCFSTTDHARSPLRLAYVGSFDPWQNVALLLAAAARVVATGVDLHITLAGSGPQEEAFKQMAASLQLGGRAAFTGYLAPARLAEHLSACDVGVCLYSGRREYRGLKLLDYKAAGLATIATGAHGEPRLIEDGRTGVIIPPDDEAGLCTAITRMAAARAETTAMGRRARLEAEAHHRWHHTAEHLSRLFERIVADRARQAHSA